MECTSCRVLVNRKTMKSEPQDYRKRAVLHQTENYTYLDQKPHFIGQTSALHDFFFVGRKFSQTRWNALHVKHWWTAILWIVNLIKQSALHDFFSVGHKFLCVVLITLFYITIWTTSHRRLHYFRLETTLHPTGKQTAWFFGSIFLTFLWMKIDHKDKGKWTTFKENWTTFIFLQFWHRDEYKRTVQCPTNKPISLFSHTKWTVSHRAKLQTDLMVKANLTKNMKIITGPYAQAHCNHTRWIVHPKSAKKPSL